MISDEESKLWERLHNYAALYRAMRAAFELEQNVGCLTHTEIFERKGQRVVDAVTECDKAVAEVRRHPELDA